MTTAVERTTARPETGQDSVALTVMRRMFDEGFATGNAGIVDELCAPDLVEHQFGMAGTGSEAIAHVKEAIRQVHTATPDMAFTIEDAVESGDTIWVRVRPGAPLPARSSDPHRGERWS